jgi:hypothetical protein
MSKREMKKPPPYFYSGEHEAKSESATEEETDDLYDSKQRETMLDEDEITAAEEGFMRGRDEPPNKKETLRKSISHDDTIAVELAKEDSEED